MQNRLNIGCGKTPLDGWINTDLEPSLPDVQYLDATKEFPYIDNYFDIVFSEHMFEHIDLGGQTNMLREVYRTLKQGGTFVLTCPTMEFLIDLYNNPTTENNKKYIEFHSKFYGGPYNRFFGTDEPLQKSIVINNFMHMWGHLSIYDCPTIMQMLDTVGFVDIVEHKVGEFLYEGEALEQHGRVIPPWANEMESRTFVCYKP